MRAGGSTDSSEENPLGVVSVEISVTWAMGQLGEVFVGKLQFGGRVSRVSRSISVVCVLNIK